MLSISELCKQSTTAFRCLPHLKIATNSLSLSHPQLLLLLVVLIWCVSAAVYSISRNYLFLWMVPPSLSRSSSSSYPTFFTPQRLDWDNLFLTYFDCQRRRLSACCRLLLRLRNAQHTLHVNILEHMWRVCVWAFMCDVSCSHARLVLR